MAKKSSGSFATGKNAPKQCTAISKRSGKQCEGPAVIGSRNQRCRMHGGVSLPGLANPSFKTGRYSRLLPQRIQELYEEALSNPDLLEMSDHIALLEARVGEILEQMKGEEIVPRWSALKEVVDEFITAALSEDVEKRNEALGKLNDIMSAGDAFDRSWGQIEGTIEQLRKVADTEIKRKKDLHQMVPVERVQVLMTAVSVAIKRHVPDPELLGKIYRELEALRTGTTLPGNASEERMPYDAPMPKLPANRRTIDVRVVGVE